MTAAMGNILRRSVSRTSKRKSPGSRPGARVESVKRRKHGKPKTAGSATGKPHPPDRKPKPAPAASRLPQRTADETLFEADFWRDLSSKMQALANEEKKILGAIREDRCLLVYCEYNADITCDSTLHYRPGRESLCKTAPAPRSSRSLDISPPTKQERRNSGMCSRKTRAPNGTGSGRLQRQPLF